MKMRKKKYEKNKTLNYVLTQTTVRFFDFFWIFFISASSSHTHTHTTNNRSKINLILQYNMIKIR